MQRCLPGVFQYKTGLCNWKERNGSRKWEGDRTALPVERKEGQTRVAGEGTDLPKERSIQ